MIKLEILIQDVGGKAKVQVAPKIPTGTKPTALERAAWQEMQGRIFARVATPAKKKK